MNRAVLRGFVAKKIAGEWIFYLSFSAFIVTSALLHRIPTYTQTDFEVIFILLVFFVIIKGLQESGMIEFITVKLDRNANTGFKFIALTAFLSMFLTNDVALLTVVPLTLSLNVEDVEFLVIVETLTANAASTLTPFGNPQNLFIFHRYGVQLLDFFLTIVPFTVVAMFLISIFVFAKREALKTEEVAKKEEKIVVGRESYVYLVFFLLFVMAILRFAPIFIGVVVLLYALIFDRVALRVDYYLLGTFFLFFGFTDNLSKIITVSFESSTNVFLTSSIFSQFMSNVPTTLLMESFTNDWKALLWGVSVGGFGTLFASLASLISYRLCAQYSRGKYLLRFHIYSFAVFATGAVLYFLIYR